MIVTIDGTAGSGKSAAALELARRLGLPHLDTGAMYRAVALDALEQHILGDPDRIGHRVRLLHIAFDWAKQPAAVLLNGRDVSDAIRRPEVTAVTYVAADNPWVREELVKQQRLIGERAEEAGAEPGGDAGGGGEKGLSKSGNAAGEPRVAGLVTEGRDQGTIVFPQAPFKFFLNAHPEERARRRLAQLAARGISAELDQVLADMELRDKQDQSRAYGKLLRAPDAIDIDTTDLSLEQTVAAMLAHIQPGRKKFE